MIAKISFNFIQFQIKILVKGLIVGIIAVFQIEFKNEIPDNPWVCEANPCCENGPIPLCCQNGVCSNENFVFNGTNDDECQCLCTDNFSGKVFTFDLNS